MTGRCAICQHEATYDEVSPATRCASCGARGSVRAIKGAGWNGLGPIVRRADDPTPTTDAGRRMRAYREERRRERWA